MKLEEDSEEPEFESESSDEYESVGRDFGVTVMGMKEPCSYEMSKVLVAVTVTVLPLVEARVVELRFMKVEVIPASVLWLVDIDIDPVSDFEVSDGRLEDVCDVVPLSELDVTAGMVTVPKPEYVIATSVVGAAI